MQILKSYGTIQLERPYKGPQRPWGVDAPHGECRGTLTQRLQTRNYPPLRRSQYICLYRYFQADFARSDGRGLRVHNAENVNKREFSA